MLEEAGYMVEKRVIETVTNEENKTLVEKQTIHVTKDDEHQPLVETQKEKCCTHCYLVAVKAFMIIFVIPLFIIASIIAWAVWLVLLPITCCCPCCEIFTVIVKFIWKFLSTVPVYLSDWVCSPESDDAKYQMARKKHRKARRAARKRKSYSTMETQTAMDDFPEMEDGVKENGGFGCMTTLMEVNEVTGEKRVTFCDDASRDVGMLLDGMDQSTADQLIDCGDTPGLVSDNTRTGDDGLVPDKVAEGDEYASYTDNDDDDDDESEISEDLLYIE